MANDVSLVEKFYAKLLNLSVTGSCEEGWLGIELGEMQILYFKSDYEIEKLQEWAWQPGYRAGAGNLTSWGLEFEENDFQKVVGNFQATAAESLYQRPDWRRDKYWGFTVKDPMGNTIELYTVPKESPGNKEWV